ncbi:DNA cytosine methyltransferase [Haliscomenobacter hydrossis]|uniref:Cytosine-specific methyltransferase n=1 Tax=Haliscomenobacter hydrossis (strain ATCC 27775 / DSM 1100 / LMG 10767 / O) TaxID=760192 RepID=F4KPK1_HALH1|nr:DNA cytosine methyltransferase [Haliscomenobacter hydrossis]AEE50939.1 DNA-cytosine methyltransferase [Haliscomenobacter hydrossis DSM 1100]
MRVVSLFSGAGGLDIGFRKAGFDIVWANDFDKNACASYSKNIGNHIRCGDINHYLDEISDIKNVDLVMGGPPCQGFSVAGKMDPKDPRSEHVWTFTKVVEILNPQAFVMENVKALGQLQKWEPLRVELLKRFRDLGYSVNYIVLNATDFDVPQARERVFFIGFKNNSQIIPDLTKMLEPYKIKAPTVRAALSVLDKAGEGNNIGVCKAKITLTPNPVMRKSPFAGMLFNGLGRPVKIDGYCATLPASMGGNKTPIIDEEELYGNKPGWVQNYHASLLNGGTPMDFQEAPKRLRRLTVEEAALLQTFPRDYEFCGSQSSKFKQIGNAVPPNLGYNIAKMMMDCLLNGELERITFNLSYQMELEAIYE